MWVHELLPTTLVQERGVQIMARISSSAGERERTNPAQPTRVADRKYLTPEQVAEQLQVTRRTVYAWLKMGRLHGVRAGKGWRIRPEEVESFLQRSASEQSATDRKPYRLYSREEILEFLKEDEFDPETVRRIEETLAR
jgi:excisionase family DNA binding protein